MKKFLTVCLVAMLLLSLWGCADNKTGQPAITSKSNTADQNNATQNLQQSGSVAEKADDGRTILKLAITQLLIPKIQKRVDTFNATNPDYVVEVLDYTPGENEEFDAGIIKLRTDILGGNAPDLMQLEGMPLSALTQKGLLEDLNGYLESDPDLGPDSLVEGAYRALSDESGLHRISPFFYVCGLYGTGSAIGDRQSWTFDELRSFLETHSAVEKPFVNMKVNRLIILTVNQFIQEDGTCNFESPEFISLLNVMKQYGGVEEVYEDNPNRAIASGEYLLSLTYLNGVDDYAALCGELDGDAKMIGMPAQLSSGNIADFPFTFAMLSSSPSKEGCWQFLKTLLDKDYQGGNAAVQDSMALEANSSEIPVLKAAFDAAVAQSSASQSVKDEFVSLVNGLQFTDDIDDRVLEIIVELLPTLYDGSMSAEEVAKTVQDKASIYLSENQ